MAVEEISLPVSRQEAFSSTRLLGTLGMLAAPMLLLEGMLHSLGYGNNPNARFISVPGMLYLAGWACSITGMRQLRATGNNALSKAIYFVQLMGLSLAFMFNVQEMLHANTDSWFFLITDMAWPASHVLMLVVGVLALTAKVWRGWRTLTPFLCGLALPAFFVARPIIGGEIAGMIFGISTAIAFMLLGYAVRTSVPIAECG